MELSLDRHVTATLSLAVLLKDDFSQKEEMIGKVKVSIPILNLEAIENPGGYYNFLNLAPDTYNVHIESDYYLDKKTDVVIPLAGYVKIFELQPDTLYPFPSWATLLRGMVSDAAGNPVTGAEIKWTAGGLHSVTSAKGEFVLYFPVAQGNASISIMVTPQGLPAKTVNNVEIKKCQTSSLTVTY